MRRPWQLALATVAALTCGCTDTSETDAGAVIQPRDRAAEAGGRVDAFTAAPDWDGLIALLRQPHALTRELLGPHRLRYTATIETGPAGIDAGAPLPDPAPGEPILERFAVTDELELRWGSQPGQAPRLHLSQHNEHGFGRELIILDERAWAALDGRGWLERPAEDELWQLWADDAQHAVLDLVELAGPHAALGEIELLGGEDEGTPAVVHVSLRASDQRRGERVVEAPTPWRRDATVELIAAELTLDRATGLWREVELELRWTFEDSAGRELSGHARFEGELEPLAVDPDIRPPSESAPLPERERPTLLRERLLDGLARP